MMPQQQAILARDMIDMVLKYSNDSDVLSYLESFAVSLMHILGDESTVDWAGLAGVCDQRYYSIKQGNPVPLNTHVLVKIQRSIAPNLTEVSEVT